MIWLLLLLCAGFIAVGIIWADELWGFVVLGGGITLLLLIILPVTTMLNSADYAELEAFYQANSRNYEITVDETASYLSQQEFTQTLIEGSLEKIELAGYVSERIGEWRDAINRYNLTIARMKYWDGNIFLGTLYPDAVRDAKLLSIE